MKFKPVLQVSSRKVILFLRARPTRSLEDEVRESKASLKGQKAVPR